MHKYTGYFQNLMMGVSAFGTVGLMLPMVANAQESQPSSAGLEEIVVTAQKRAENLQDTPISISALTSTALENKGINDITDLRSSVPSLQVTPHPNSAVTAIVYIRGVGNRDDQFTQDPSVAVYLDGVYVARSQGLAGELAELERIEVLRGPQGSLYGRNATGGAINYISKAPELGTFGLKQSLMVGNYDQFRSRTNVNVPIGETLAIELGYLHSQKDGYVKNLGTGVSRWGDQRRTAYRAAAHWQPTDVLDLKYTYDRSDINDTPSFMVPAPFYPAKAARPTAGSPLVRDLQKNDATAQGHNLTMSFDVADELTLKSITGYRKLKNFSYQDYHTGVLAPRPIILTTFDQNQKQFSEELQAVGKAFDGRLDYVIGGYYFSENGGSFDTSRSLFSATGTNRTVRIKNKAYAVFGQATFRPAFSEGLYITGGLRWSRDERAATMDLVALPTGGTPITLPSGNADRKFSNVSPSFIIGYNVDKNINVYAKYSKGYKTGGFNIRASSITKFNEGFGPETLDGYELGLKSTLLDDRLRFNLALFQSDYKDIQINVQPGLPGITDTFNAGKARIRGVELDITAKPSPNLTVGVSYAYVDAGYKKILDPAGNDITGRYTFIEAPDHTISANLEYNVAETSIGNLIAYVDYFMQSKKQTNSTNPLYVIGDYGILNGRLILSQIPLGIGNAKLSVFGKNLTDTKYYTTLFNGGIQSAIFGDPRTYGLELTFEY